jgi:hypothetical protein
VEEGRRTPGRRPWEPAGLWEQDAVDDVDDPVAGLDIDRQDLGFVDVGAAADDGRGDAAPVEHPDRVGTDDRGGILAAGRDVVEQDVRQVALGQRADGAGVQAERGEGGVGRGEDRELAIAVEGVDESGRADQVLGLDFSFVTFFSAAGCKL